MQELRIRGRRPGEMSLPALIDAVYLAAETLDIWECYSHEHRYHFALGGGWSLALSSDSAARIRVESCRLTQPVSTMWSPAHRTDRLAGLIAKMSTAPSVA